MSIQFTDSQRARMEDCKMQIEALLESQCDTPEHRMIALSYVMVNQLQDITDIGVPTAIIRAMAQTWDEVLGLFMFTRGNA